MIDDWPAGNGLLGRQTCDRVWGLSIGLLGVRLPVITRSTRRQSCEMASLWFSILEKECATCVSRDGVSLVVGVVFPCE